jgi:pimeloyl-ACP methyl ester carboxylesterase
LFIYLIGNTTSGNKKFSIPQFAEDTSGLMDALKIKKADIIGWSMGGMIAQELVLSNPEKVESLSFMHQYAEEIKVFQQVSKS